MTNLRNLDLSYTNVQLPNWEEVFLKLTKLESLTLVKLDIFVPMFSHVSHALYSNRQLTNLKYLDIRGYIRGDLNVVSSLTKLETLMIGVYPTVNWEVLKALPKLSYIKIDTKSMGASFDQFQFNEGRIVKCEINKIS